MTKNWSFAQITDNLPKNWGQWSYLKITISTKTEMSIPLPNQSTNRQTIQLHFTQVILQWQNVENFHYSNVNPIKDNLSVHIDIPFMAVVWQVPDAIRELRWISDHPRQGVELYSEICKNLY